jgi:predicted DNA-binding transcriptional regulator YafY
MTSGILDKTSRVERLRDIKKRIDRKEKFTAFDIAVWYDVSINVAYRDIKTLKDGGYIPSDWTFAPKAK